MSDIMNCPFCKRAFPARFNYCLNCDTQYRPARPRMEKQHGGERREVVVEPGVGDHPGSDTGRGSGVAGMEGDRSLDDAQARIKLRRIHEKGVRWLSSES
jgi:hypothetical protein